MVHVAGQFFGVVEQGSGSLGINQSMGRMLQNIADRRLKRATSNRGSELDRRSLTPRETGPRCGQATRPRCGRATRPRCGRAA
ncbi:unnamed protein product [Nesidiocoris tenuis]|uniref:Uncharacterized protein n=1 Tax=Nesidiocoris tenuis TaxID=355587 RepID=A0A6H5GUJ8_9HEMI|nr:unnamed protein product [Nesidiocoris tenuis]